MTAIQIFQMHSTLTLELEVSRYTCLKNNVLMTQGLDSVTFHNNQSRAVELLQKITQLFWRNPVSNTAFHTSKDCSCN